MSERLPAGTALQACLLGLPAVARPTSDCRTLAALRPWPLLYCRQYPAGMHVLVKGFVTNMPEIMSASGEATAAPLPLLCPCFASLLL